MSNGKNEKGHEIPESILDILFGGGGVVMIGNGVPFGVGIGSLFNAFLRQKDDAMYKIAEFVVEHRNLDGDEQQDLANKAISEFINIDFETELLDNYQIHRYCDHCDGRKLINDFVTAIGLDNFSEDFRTKWISMQPYTLEFGKTKLIIGGLPATVIDHLIRSLDEIDQIKKDMSERFGGSETKIMNIKDSFGPMSTATFAVEKLIELSRECTIGSPGYIFVKNIVSRIGVDNLSPLTQKSYYTVFPKA